MCLRRLDKHLFKSLFYIWSLYWRFATNSWMYISSDLVLNLRNVCYKTGFTLKIENVSTNKMEVDVGWIYRNTRIAALVKVISYIYHGTLSMYHGTFSYGILEWAIMNPFTKSSVWLKIITRVTKDLKLQMSL